MCNLLGSMMLQLNGESIMRNRRGQFDWWCLIIDVEFFFKPFVVSDFVLNIIIIIAFLITFNKISLA